MGEVINHRYFGDTIRIVEKNNFFCLVVAAMMKTKNTLMFFDGVTQIVVRYWWESVQTLTIYRG